MTQQSFSQVLPQPPARESDETIVDTNSVLVHQTNTLALQASAESISHRIDKIIKKNTREYSCNTCNTHYSKLSWVIEDHPDYDVKNFNVINMDKQEEVLTI